MNQNLSFSFLPSFSMESVSKCKDLLLFESILLTRLANRKSQKLFLFVKMAAKHEGVPIHIMAKA